MSMAFQMTSPYKSAFKVPHPFKSILLLHFNGLWAMSTGYNEIT